MSTYTFLQCQRSKIRRRFVKLAKEIAHVYSHSNPVKYCTAAPKYYFYIFSPREEASHVTQFSDTSLTPRRILVFLSEVQAVDNFCHWVTTAEKNLSAIFSLIFSKQVPSKGFLLNNRVAEEIPRKNKPMALRTLLSYFQTCSSNQQRPHSHYELSEM